MARILIVDDEPDMRLAIRNVLRLRGYEIVEASDGPSALEIIKNNNIDLMLLDIRLPGMDGIEVLEKTKEINESIPVVMITGYGHIQSAVDVMKLGANEYLQKPFDNTQLVNAIKKLLEEKYPPRTAAKPPDQKEQIEEIPSPVPQITVKNYKKFILAGVTLLIVAMAVSIYLLKYWTYHKIYKIDGLNITSILWHNNELWASDWVEQSICRYAVEKGKLARKQVYELDGVHITGFTLANNNVYIVDSWKKVIEKRNVDDGLSLVRKYPLAGKITGLFFDGEYLWSIDTDGTVLLHKLDDALSVARHFKLKYHPDMIYKDKKNLWTGVSASGEIYKHSLNDKLSVSGVYKVKNLEGEQPLSAITRHKGRFWIARDSVNELLEISPSHLKPVK